MKIAAALTLGDLGVRSIRRRLCDFRFAGDETVDQRLKTGDALDVCVGYRSCTQAARRECLTHLGD